jgi:hypothetical protein
MHAHFAALFAKHCNLVAAGNPVANASQHPA